VLILSSVQTKYIFVTGGVVSGLGKGLTASSLGALLKASGYSVAIQKLDPYFNVDPGTMNPFQHGEVYVLDDGSETDLDLGHYERFIDSNLNKNSNATSGAIYSEVIQNEREGKYLGETVQVIPHVTDSIKQRILSFEGEVDIAIIELGGTVGDIEILPYLEAIRQMQKEVGRENVCYIHLTLVPYIAPSQEFKTKPTQHSVSELRSRGVTPDVIVLRCTEPVEQHLKDKIARLCDVLEENVISAHDAKTLYFIPQVMHEQGLDSSIAERLGLSLEKQDLSQWRDLEHKIRNTQSKLNVAIVGKYQELPDAYLSVFESIYHGGFNNLAKVEVTLIDADTPAHALTEVLSEMDALVVPGGFGYRGVEGKILAVQYARENNIPFLGICLGLQVAVIEYARNLCGFKDANSTEFVKDSEYPVVALMEEQEGVTDLGGTMRLGAQEAVLVKGSLANELYGALSAVERHRHRWEVNNAYVEKLEAEGLIISGRTKDTGLVEYIELPKDVHKYFIATQAHPEFTSRPNRPNPLFDGLIKAALKKD
jgi:CTP synthase